MALNTHVWCLYICLRVVRILWLIGVECQNIASAWSTAGAKGIALVGRNIGKLEETAKPLKVPSIVVSGNVTSESDIESIFEKAVAEFGELGVLINTAETMNQGVVTGEIEPAQWWVDFVSSYAIARMAYVDAKAGVEREGHI